jgi:hypothetical protein
LQGVKPSCVGGPAIDLGAAVDRAPDQIGIEPDDRIAPAHSAAFDRFQEKARSAAGDLEEGRHRRFEIGNERGPDDLACRARNAWQMPVLAARSAWENQYVGIRPTADHLIESA